MGANLRLLRIHLPYGWNDQPLPLYSLVARVFSGFGAFSRSDAVSSKVRPGPLAAGPRRHGRLSLRPGPPLLPRTTSRAPAIS